MNDFSLFSRYFANLHPSFKYMIKADDDVMVVVQELIDFISDPSLPSEFLLGFKLKNRPVIRNPGKTTARWLATAKNASRFRSLDFANMLS